MLKQLLDLIYESSISSGIMFLVYSGKNTNNIEVIPIATNKMSITVIIVDIPFSIIV